MFKSVRTRFFKKQLSGESPTWKIKGTQFSETRFFAYLFHTIIYKFWMV